jgi:hypothetical protein
MIIVFNIYLQIILKSRGFHSFFSETKSKLCYDTYLNNIVYTLKPTFSSSDLVTRYRNKNNVLDTHQSPLYTSGLSWIRHLLNHIIQFQFPHTVPHNMTCN